MASPRRGSTSALVPFAALALLAGGFLAARPDRVPEAARAPTGAQTSAPPAHASPPPNASTRPPTPLVPSEDAAARAAARRFLAGYLRLVRGRGSVRTLRHTAPALRRELRRHPARATPVQQAHPSTIRGLDVKQRSPDSARAIAILQDAGGPPYAVLLYLEPRGSDWRVTRIGDAEASR